MLNKLKKILQWFVSVCFILSGLIYVGEYTVPAIVLMVYYLLGDYDSDYDKYTDLEGAAEAMKEYPHEVYLMTIDTGYAA